MPRVHVYLPDDLYTLMKEHQLPAFKLLQEAVRSEIRRRQLVAVNEAYTEELVKRIGEPTARQRTRAEALAKRIAARKGTLVGQ